MRYRFVAGFDVHRLAGKTIVGVLSICVEAHALFQVAQVHKVLAEGPGICRILFDWSLGLGHFLGGGRGLWL